LYEFDDPDAAVPRSVALPVGFELGSSHDSELSYLFNPGPLVHDGAPARTAAQEQLSDQLQRAWGAFAHLGDASIRGAAWPAYDTRTDLVMRLQPGGIRITSDYAAAHRCDCWDPLGL
jgi:para-nitrobenzyl esterase